MDRYLMYLRKSRADRDFSDEDTLQRHRARLEELCSQRRITCSEVLQEVSSADSIAGRPEMMRLLAMVETGEYAGVVCIDMDRLSRGSGADQALVINTFKYSHTRIITPQKDYDFEQETDEQFAELGLFLGRSEYRLIKRRLMQGRIDSTKEGKYAGGNAPYGYITYKLEKQKGYSLRIVPEQADVIREIYRLYTDENIGCRAIAARINSQGHRNQFGRTFTETHIYKILNDPTYMGKVRFRDHTQSKAMRGGELVTVEHKNHDPIIVDGVHEAIISEDTFLAAQDAKKNRRTPHVRLEAKMQNPLCSLLVCSQCGKKLALRSESRRGVRTVYCRTPGCGCGETPIELVEARLLEALEYWLDGYVIEVEDESRLQSLKDESARVMETIRTEKKRLDRIHDLLERDVYTLEEFQLRRDKSEAALKAAEERFQELELEAARVEAYEETKQGLAPSVRGVIDQYRLLTTPKEKNLLLKSVLDHAVYTKTAKGRGHLHDFDLTIFPLLPKL